MAIKSTDLKVGQVWETNDGWKFKILKKVNGKLRTEREQPITWYNYHPKVLADVLSCWGAKLVKGAERRGK